MQLLEEGALFIHGLEAEGRAGGEGETTATTA
jgi:hypothetical protein